MGVLVGIISQKGGVGKSMVSRLLGTEYTRVGWRALIADMDSSQSTSKEWGIRRSQQGIEPAVEISAFGMVEEVLQISDQYDIILFDGAPHSTRTTKTIAEVSDLIILPTGSSLDDLNPQIRLAHELVDNGIKKEKIIFILSRVGSSKAELKDARNYIAQTEYYLLDGFIPERTAFRQAIRDGRTLTETRYFRLTEKCEAVTQSVADIIKEIKK